MSGPKVVKIVTREERIAICQCLLARLDKAVSEWQRQCEWLGTDSRDDFDATLKRNEAIHALLDKDAFSELQKEAPGEIAFLQSDLKKRIEKAAEKKTRDRTARRRLSSAAATLMASLEKSGSDIPTELMDALRAAGNSAEEGVKAAESAISQALKLIAPTNNETDLGERQLELAKRLGEGEETQTLFDWIAGRQTTDDEAGQEIDRHIAELETAEGEEIARPFAERAEVMAAEPSAQQRQLLADSLIVDLAEQARLRREKSSLLLTLSGLVAELEQIGNGGTNALKVRTTGVLERQDVEEAQVLIPAVEEAISNAHNALAAPARRSAVLEALSGLGYEVREGMNTAWSQNGNVVLRSASHPDYGVKLSGGVNSRSVQFRAVGFGRGGAARNEEQDKDMEEFWCSDFNRLKSQVSDAGGDIEIVHSTPVGGSPLEVIEESDGVHDGRRAIPRRPQTKRREP